MSWIQRYELKHYLRNSIWILPAFGMLAAIALARCLNWIEVRAGWQSDFSPDAARALFGTLAGAMLTFIVFISSILLLVLQMAGAQLTPRIIGLVFRNWGLRLALTLFTFTFAFTLCVLLRIGKFVPGVTAYLSAYLSVLCVVVFLYLVDRVCRALRPSGALRAVARTGRDVVQSVYPRAFSGEPDSPKNPAGVPGEAPTCTILSRKDGVFLAFDLEGIVAFAAKIGCVMELVPQVGDFVAAESPLFRVYGAEEDACAKMLRRSVALGQERTMEQDPEFAFRIIVDVASKGLSPAINDPTTAVLALDQIQCLLRAVGTRHLDEGLACDRSGTLRLIYRTPDWPDFVSLAVTEIRQFGGTSIQVVRRLRAMLENLIESLPAARTELLRGELALLRRSAGRLFSEPEDQALADVSDLQGMGGKPPGPRHGRGPGACNGGNENS